MQAPDVVFTDEQLQKRTVEDIDWGERASAPELWPVSLSDGVWILAGLALARLLLSLA